MVAVHAPLYAGSLLRAARVIRECYGVPETVLVPWEACIRSGHAELLQTTCFEFGFGASYALLLIDPPPEIVLAATLAGYRRSGNRWRYEVRPTDEQALAADRMMRGYGRLSAYE